MDDVINNYECYEYLDIELFSEKFIDSIIEEAQSTVKNETQGNTDTHLISKDYALRSSLYSTEYFTFIDEHKEEFTCWPTIETFTIKLGASKINEYLSSFPVKEEWLYAIYFLKSIDEQVSSLYEYEAIWSLPTEFFPIAQVTASVFFTIEVSKVLPKQCPVKLREKTVVIIGISGTETSIVYGSGLVVKNIKCIVIQVDIRNACGSLTSCSKTNVILKAPASLPASPVLLENLNRIRSFQKY